jgi:cobalt-zinc-cadmium resistance protein CzcA
VVVPLVLVGILAVLVWTFRALGPALIILLNVPFACVGGAALLLTLRGSRVDARGGGLHRAVGHRGAQRRGAGWGELLERVQAASARRRPATRHGAHAAGADDGAGGGLGFVPMMLATGVGPRCSARWRRWWWAAFLTSTLLTLVVLPALVAWWGRRRTVAE